MRTFISKPSTFRHLLIVTFMTLTTGIQFPNDIIGDPVVRCQQGIIDVKVETKNDKPSRIFAKGCNDKQGCFFETTNEAVFTFEKCNMLREREINPRGMAYTFTVIVQLHPLFITKVDKAYHIRCFYVETERQVSFQLGISTLPPQVIHSGHAMPQCMYGLHNQGPNGPMVRYSKVGDEIWHVWDCPSDVYGMLVHSCHVLDGRGNRVLVIDENGCGVDDFVMQTPVYSGDLTRAQQQTHVFKFADRITVTFNCEIRLCFISGHACKGITPPNCDKKGAIHIEYTKSRRVQSSSNTKNYTAIEIKGADFVGEADLNSDELLTTSNIDEHQLITTNNNSKKEELTTSHDIKDKLSKSGLILDYISNKSSIPNEYLNNMVNIVFNEGRKLESEQLEEMDLEQGSGEEKEREENSGFLTLDSGLIHNQSRGRRNALNQRRIDNPSTYENYDIVDLDIHSELAVLEQDKNIFDVENGHAISSSNRLGVCISSMGFSLLISTAFFSLIICTTAFFISIIRMRRGVKTMAIIRAVDRIGL